MSKVLIIDDSATEVQQLKANLEGAGYDTLSACSGEEGVAVAKSELPDVILMDIVMPGLNGFPSNPPVAQECGNTENTRHCCIHQG